MTDLDLDEIRQGHAICQTDKCLSCDTEKRLIAEIERLSDINKTLGSALVDMVAQHTRQLDDSYRHYAHTFMAADEQAFDALVEAGLAEVGVDGHSIRLHKEAFSD